MFLQIADGRKARRHRQRIAAESSGLINRPQRRQQIHEIAFAAEDADRQPSADDFSQRDEVGIERVKLARAAERNAKAGHDFIHNQQRAVAAP